jgi:hypothetical protein
MTNRDLDIAETNGGKNSVFRIRIWIGSGFNQVSGSVSGFGIQIRIQEGKNYPQKNKKIQKINVLRCRIFSFEG